MLTGFNTDVEWEGVTYHVQTEDKGLANPIILSLIYIRGTILAARRTPYQELISDGVLDQKRLAKAIEKQHFTILAAIKAGKVEQLVKKLNADSAAKAESERTDPHPVAETLAEAVPEIAITATATVSEAPPPAAPVPVVQATPTVPATVGADAGPGRELTAPRLVPGEAVNELPKDAPKPSSRLRERSASPGTGSLSVSADSFDDLFAGLLKSNESREKLGIELLTHPRLIAGEDVTIQGAVLFDGQWPAVNAPVKGQIVGTTIRPQSFYAHADASGNFSVTVRLPEFTSGTAALILHVQDPKGQEAEIKLLIRKR